MQLESIKGKKDDELVSLCYYLSTDMRDRLKIYAASHKMSVQDVVRLAIEQEIENVVEAVDTV